MTDACVALRRKVGARGVIWHRFDEIFENVHGEPLHHTVLSKATPDGDARMLQCGMAEDAEIRRKNFRAYWGDNWSPSSAASRLWGTASQWSDLYHGRKSFGEKLARQIEDRLGLARLSLDDPGGPTMAPLSSALLERLEAAGPEERQRLENMLRAHFGMPQLGPLIVTASKKRSQRLA